MFNSSDAPPDHFTDWSGWNWFLGIAGTFLMLAIASSRSGSLSPFGIRRHRMSRSGK